MLVHLFFERRKHNHNGRKFFIRMFTDLFTKLNSIHSWHMVISDDQVVWLVFTVTVSYFYQRFFTTGCLFAMDTKKSKELIHQPPAGCIIIYNKYILNWWLMQ